MKQHDLSCLAGLIAAHQKGQHITASCPTCDKKLTVTDDPELGSLWATCETGCTKFHLRYEPQPKAA